MFHTFARVTREQQQNMSNEERYMNGNGVKHVSNCCATTWPPAWLDCPRAPATPISTPAEPLVAPTETPIQPVAEPVVAQVDEEQLDVIDPIPDPCPTCGTLELWETLAGTWRCQRCDAAALRRSDALAARAARIRQRSQGVQR